jgi:hypothetical protein
MASMVAKRMRELRAYVGLGALMCADVRHHRSKRGRKGARYRCIVRSLARCTACPVTAHALSVCALADACQIATQ